MAQSLQEVRGILLSLWPPGRLYDWATRTSAVSRILDALAESIKTFGYDVLDLLRREMNPATAVQKLPDWEEALGLSSTYTARNGTVAQRQAAIVGKLREFGALTLANARAILAPLLGYADPAKLAILEVSRDQMRLAHTYVDGAPQAFGSGDSSKVSVTDGGVVSGAGAQLDLQFVAVPAAPFVVTLHSPTQRARQWMSASLGPYASKYHLCAPEFASDTCTGIWTVGVQALSFNTSVPALASCSIFVEGVGPSGLGGDLVSWAIFVDSTLAGKSVVPADLDGARAGISRIKHAHTSGYVLTSMAAIPDDPSSLPDACLPA